MLLLCGAERIERFGRIVWAFVTMSVELLWMAEVTKMVTSPRSVREIRRVGVMTDQCAAQSVRFHPSWLS